MSVRFGPDAPVVLDEHRDVVVVGVVDDERLVGLPAPQRHRKQEIAIVNPAVAVVIEIGEVLDELDAALLKDAEIETAVDVLPLAAGAHGVRAADERHGVGKLEAALGRALGDTERAAVLDARKSQLRTGDDRRNLRSRTS